MNRYNEQTRLVAPAPIVRRMSAEESAALQRWTQPGQAIQLENAFQAQEGAKERIGGVERSLALLVRLAPLAVLWGILGALCAFVLALLIEVDATTSAAAGLFLFIWLSYNSYAGADERERYDSPNGVEHHRINAATGLAERQQDLDDTHRREMARTYLQHLEGGNGGNQHQLRG